MLVIDRSREVAAVDPTLLIVTALEEGAGRSRAPEATGGVVEAFRVLAGLVSDRFSRNPTARVVLESYLCEPSSRENRRLEEFLGELGAASDQAVISAAQRLMALLDADGALAGRYSVHLPEVGEGRFNDHRREDRPVDPGWGGYR